MKMQKTKIQKRIIKYQYKLILIIMFGIFALADNSNAAPSVESVSGTVEDGQNITISGSGFGASGPNVVLFDDFSEGTTGQTMLRNATVGMWGDERINNLIYFSNPSLSNGKGARSATNTNVYHAYLNTDQYTNVYMSHTAYVPNGYKFPYSNSANAWPTRSAYKAQWLYGGTYGFNGSTQASCPEGDDLFHPCTADWINVCWTGGNLLPSATNQGWCNQAFDDGHIESYWSWDSPNRIAAWIKGNGPIATGSDGFIQLASPNGQVLRRYNADIIEKYGDYEKIRPYPQAWFCSEMSQYTIDHFSVPGYLRPPAVGWTTNKTRYWDDHIILSPFNNFVYKVTNPIRNGGSAVGGATEPIWPTIDGATVIDGGVTWTAYDTRLYPEDNLVIDDVYIAVGDNAAARVEIGNNPVYTNCTKLALATPTSWADGSITATVREGTFKSGETGYIFVLDKDNNVSNSSQGITFGSEAGSGDEAPPSNPTELVVS